MIKNKNFFSPSKLTNFYIPFLLLFTLFFLKLNHQFNANELNYFLQSILRFDVIESFRNYASFEPRLHKLLSELIIFLPLKLFGVDYGYVFLKLIVVCGLSFGFYYFSKIFNISLWVILLSLILFLKGRQSYFGGEWIVDGVEAKVFAYICSLLSFYFLNSVNKKYFYFFSALSILFHFQVGVFWAFIYSFYNFLNDKNFKLFFKNIIFFSFFLFIVLLFYSFSSPNFNLLPVDTSDVDINYSANYIYSKLRVPHHVAPFNGLEFDHWIWKSGLTSSLRNCLILIFIYFFSYEKKLKNFILVIVVGHIYLFIALIISFYDQTNYNFASFYLFRPAAFMKFFSIALFINFVSTKLENFKFKHSYLFNLLGYVLIFLFMLRSIDFTNKNQNVSFNTNDKSLLDWIEMSTNHSEIFLISNYKSKSYLNEYNFEMYAKRPSLVNWKFVPVSNIHLLDWYKNNIKKRNFFDTPCNIESKFNFNYILLNTVEKKQLFNCYQNVYENDSYVVYKVE